MQEILAFWVCLLPISSSFIRVPNIVLENVNGGWLQLSITFRGSPVDLKKDKDKLEWQEVLHKNEGVVGNSLIMLPWQ